VILVLVIGLGAANLHLQAEDIEWMDPKWVAGTKLETADAVSIADWRQLRTFES